MYNNNSQSFTVILPVYIKENPLYLKKALESIWDDQTLKPKQIIIIEDGPLTDALYSEIQSWKDYLGDTLDVTSFKTNVGLGIALKKGIDLAKYDLIARMDADDIAHPSRFQMQIDFMIQNPHISVCGSSVTEFINEGELLLERQVPESHSEIVQYSKRRNPLNHPTVVFRKATLNQLGSYEDMRAFEDYFLWLKLLKGGALFSNLALPLVNMRVGSSFIARRTGFKYAQNECKFWLSSFQRSYISALDLFFNLLTRTFVRLLPLCFLEFIYSRSRKKYIDMMSLTQENKRDYPVALKR